ncbi:TorF family putative porin [Pelagerythrobacter marensis]|uniref:TorF family putative porin n=1 Tax=Pelagerythrobacter marensis TaxID=543877 RepID=A0ABZ2D0G2_9SPHN
MLTSIRGLAAATFLTSTVMVAVPAQAQDRADPPAAVEVSGNVAITSDYRFRGVSLSGGDLAIQGGIDLTHASGFYVGTWGSSIDDGGTDLLGDVELDLYGGWSGEVSDGVTLDVGLLYYMYPTEGLGADTDYFEPYASVAFTLGPAEATLGAAYAFDQDALGDSDNLYVYTDLGIGIPNTPISLSGHLGYTDGVLAPPALAGSTDESGLDWALGASATVLGGLEIGVTYVGTEGPSVDGLTDDAVVATLGMSF